MSQRRFTALGTASQVPTRNRNHNGYFLRWDNQGFLFDPGEGTQRQMIHAGISASKITKIFITHFHGDHCLGLAGVLQRLSLDRVSHTIQLYYPASGQIYLDNLKDASIYHKTAKIKEYPISSGGEIYSGKNISINTLRLDHTVESWGFRINENDRLSMLADKLDEFGISGKEIGELRKSGSIEKGAKAFALEDFSVEKKGRSFAFVMDTGVCSNALKLAENVDLLVTESTYLNSEKDEAISRKHLTAMQAAKIAKDSNARKLVLTHFSQRYENLDEFLIEASAIHADVVVVNDGDSVDFPKRP